MSINTTMFEMSDDKKEQLGQRINIEDRPSSLGRRKFCSHCKFESSRLFKIRRESFFNMRDEGLITDDPAEDFLPGGPFLFCHNGCAVEFFWRRYQLGRLRGDLKTRDSRDPLDGLPTYSGPVATGKYIKGKIKGKELLSGN